MIVVSASLRKSGSGWYFSLTNDLLVRAGEADAREVRRRHGLEVVMRGENCRVDLTAASLAKLVRASLHGASFAVKTHAPPTPALRALLRLGAARVTCLHRDPRDVVLSALDQGERARRAGRGSRLAAVTNVAEAVAWLEPRLEAWQPWLAAPRSLIVRYEDLVADTRAELARLAGFLGLEVDGDAVAEVAAAYAGGRSPDGRPAKLHFSRGVPGRFRRELGPADLALCNARFAAHLRRMGYVE